MFDQHSIASGTCGDNLREDGGLNRDGIEFNLDAAHRHVSAEKDLAHPPTQIQLLYTVKICIYN